MPDIFVWVFVVWVDLVMVCCEFLVRYAQIVSLILKEDSEG